MFLELPLAKKSGLQNMYLYSQDIALQIMNCFFVFFLSNIDPIIRPAWVKSGYILIPHLQVYEVLYIFQNTLPVLSQYYPNTFVVQSQYFF